MVGAPEGECSLSSSPNGEYRVTTVLLNASLGSEQYQSVNSRIALSYDSRELG
jgi:hypothetical protein